VRIYIYIYIGEKQFGESRFRLVSFPSPLVVANRNIIVRKKMLRVLLPRFLSRREARLVRKSDARIARSSVIKSLIAFTHPPLRFVLLFLSYSGTVRAMQWKPSVAKVRKLPRMTSSLSIVAEVIQTIDSTSRRRRKMIDQWKMIRRAKADQSPQETTRSFLDWTFNEKYYREMLMWKL